MNIRKSIAEAYRTFMGSNLPQNINTGADRNQRGINIYTTSQLQAVTARDKQGHLQNVSYEQSIFYLTVEERLAIFRLCAPVQGVITSRANRISGLKWKVTCDRKEEDRKAQRLKNMYEVYKEFSTLADMKYIIARADLNNALRKELPDLLPDLSNFNKAMLRWSRRLQDVQTDKSDQIVEWMMQPNQNDDYTSFTKQWIIDLNIHGSCSIYKDEMNGKVENVYILPGGTVMPIKNPFVGGATAFVQITQMQEPKVYSQNELCFSQYIPYSARAHGIVPLEALINKISETMLFDKLMADQADGTKLPEKMIIITEDSPFGQLDGSLKIPINPDEQKRFEQKINTPKKGALMTFSGNNATVVDLSRENTMSIQMQRQKDIREEVALVYNATNMEMNLTGSEDTSGRSTSEEQRLILQAKGTGPQCQTLADKWNREILPFRFGWGHSFEFDISSDEKETIELLTLKNQSGLYSVNELRTKDMNLDGFDGEEFDKPQQTSTVGQGESAVNPMYMKGV